MLRRLWKPIAAGAVVGTPAYLYYTSRKTFEFRYPVRDAEGNRTMTTKRVPLLSANEAEKVLKEHAVFKTESRPNGLKWNYTTTSVASNSPLEDANASQIVQRDEIPEDYLFFTVMDGHSGTHTSQLLSRTLIKAVALEIALAEKQVNEKSSSSSIFNLSKWVGGSKQSSAESDSTSPISLAMQRAFVSLDSELSKAPIRILMENMTEEMLKAGDIPDLSKHPMALDAMLPALSGSCAIMALVDTAREDLYVAVTGDCRAVSGAWEPASDGSGKWHVDVLTEDQTAKNPAEVKRILSEHPPDEISTAVKNGRVLGNLEPSRAFGDARYKWPLEIQKILNQAIMVGNGMPIRFPANLKTPPYVTAQPVVTHRKIKFNDDDKNTTIKFIVLATDGLWDELSSEEVVTLVGGYFAGIKGTISKEDLTSRVPIAVDKAAVEGKYERRNRQGASWQFVDDNPSTHLIRNALGYGDKRAMRELLSIPAPYSRRYRDDITVTVVWWEKGDESNPNVSALSGTVKAKL